MLDIRLIFAGNALLLLSLAWLFSGLTSVSVVASGLAAIALCLVVCLAELFMGGQKLNRGMFLLLIGICLSAELVARLRLPKSVYNTDIFRVPRPYVMYAGLADGHTRDVDPTEPGNALIDFQLDHLGFRNESAPTKEKTSGEMRVFLTGGSVVFNGSSLESTIAGQLEKLAHEHGYKNVRVYNFGIISGVSGMELSLLVHDLVDLRPDLVISLSGANDVASPLGGDPRPGYPYNFVAFETLHARLAGGRNVELSSLYVPLLLRSRAVEYFFGSSLQSEAVNLDEKRRKAGYMTPTWEEAITFRYLGNLQKMCALSQALNFKFGAALQPIAHLKSPHIGAEQAILGGPDFRDYILRQFGRLQRAFADSTAESTNTSLDNCLMIDLTRIFENYDQEIFRDFIHINNHGNRRVAEKLYEELATHSAF